MKDPANAIRNEARKYAMDHCLTFYDVRTWQGFLRNLILRNTDAGGLMVILVVRSMEDQLVPMMEHLADKFPEITSFYYVINPKQNDTIYDLEFNLFKGDAYITERMPSFRPEGKEIEFRIGPASFFQTNSGQAINLYRIAAEMANPNREQLFYDLYTGTGTIANYIAPYVKRVIGIESVAAAIADAEINSRINGNINSHFFSGETEKILTPEFIAAQGRPDVIITDPPRNGMHEKVVRTLMEVRPEKIVYVSCNPATQARDLGLLNEHYRLEKCQPVDMFPHTQHVENVALLLSRD
jgi:23S rRNA (uracil1939-C5)-methyltransferase